MVNMDKKKLGKQIAVIALVIALFAGLDTGIYQLFIKRVISHHSPGMLKMSVEVGNYVPFTGSENISSADGAARLEGDIPTIDGAAALLPMYAGFVESIYPEDSVIFNGETYDDSSSMHYTNTRGAYKAIVDGDCDIVIGVKPSEEQLAYAAENGVELEMVEIGREAFVFIVSADNPVSDLTSDQIRGIYSGEITNWNEVGGEDQPIKAFTRNRNSGSQEKMEKLVMKGTPMIDAPELRGGSMIWPYMSLHASVDGIAYSPYYYYLNMSESIEYVKAIAINGVPPTKEHIRDKSYPYVSSVVAVIRSDTPADSYARKIFDYLTTDDGKKIIEASGYVAN